MVFMKNEIYPVTELKHNEILVIPELCEKDPFFNYFALLCFIYLNGPAYQFDLIMEYLILSAVVVN